MVQEANEKIFFSWMFPEFEKYERGRSWYIISGAIIVLLLIYAVWTANYLFALIVAILAIIILVSGNREPNKIRFSISEEGISVGNGFHRYADLKNFWIVYQPPEVKMLYFTFKNNLRPELSIPLYNNNPLKIRETLLRFMEEDLSRETEPFSDQFGKWLKL